MLSISGKKFAMYLTIQSAVSYSLQSKIYAHVITPKNIRLLARAKKHAYHKKTSLDSRLEYKAIAKQYESAVKDFNTMREKSLLDNPSLASFYSFVNSKLNSKKSIPALLVSNNQFTTDSSAKANILNSFFSSVFTQDNGISLNFPDRTDPDDFLSFIEFSYTKVADALQNLPSKTSRSPDGYPALFLKYIALEIAYPLSLLFELSMKTCILPSIWKTAIVTPAFKKGQASQSSNYRPISLTSIVCKVMESIIRKDMTTFLNDHDLLINKGSVWIPI